MSQNHPKVSELHAQAARLTRAVALREMGRGAALGWIGGALLAGCLLLPLRQGLRMPLSDLRLLFLVAPGLALLGAARAARRHRFGLASSLALLDARCHCGGLLVAEGLPGWEAWQHAVRLPAHATLHRRGARLWPRALLSALFALTCGLWPDRPAQAGAARRMEIAADLAPLRDQAEALKELLPDDALAQEWLDQLARIEENALSDAPSEVWDALDTLAARIREESAGAMDDALDRFQELDQLAALAQALREAVAETPASEGLSQALAQTLEELANALRDQALATDSKAMAEVAQSLREAGSNGVPNAAALQKMIEGLNLQKAALASNLTQWSAAKLIDPGRLAACTNSAACAQAAAQALDAMLKKDGTPSSCRNGQCDGNALCALLGQCAMPGAGGMGRGPGAAPMIVGEPVGEDGVQPVDRQLAAPERIDMRDMRLQGLGAAAPQTDAVAPTAAGRLNAAAADGGAARRRSVLPRHRRAVAAFFNQNAQKESSP
jgi:hypothetical protein